MVVLTLLLFYCKCAILAGEIDAEATTARGPYAIVILYIHHPVHPMEGIRCRSHILLLLEISFCCTCAVLAGGSGHHGQKAHKLTWSAQKRTKMRRSLRLGLAYNDAGLAERGTCTGDRLTLSFGCA